MRTGCRTALAASFVIAMAVAGCATPADPPREVSPGPSGDDVSLGKTSISAVELRDLQAQPADEQRRRLDIVLASHPDELAARFLRTQAEFTLGDVDAVIADSEAVLAMPSLNAHFRLRVLDWRAEALLQVKRRREALDVANQALDIEGSDAKALFTRGWTIYLIDNSQTEKALADLDRALQRDPDQGIGYFRRATVLQAQGKFDRATEDFERALQLAPDDAPTHAGYGALALQIKDFQRALAQFDAAARLTPRDPSIWTSRAEADVGLNRFEDATTDASHAIELGAMGEDLANAHAILGFAHQKQMDFAGAAREYQRALAANADSPVAARLTRMQWFSGQFAQAIEPLRKQASAPDADPYAALWLFIVRVHADPAAQAEATTELAGLTPAHQPRVWTDTLVDLIQGKSSLEAALAEADAAATGELRAGQRCEADYYAAERLLMRGQDVAATPLLEEAYWVCPSTYTEAQAVVAERRLLAARSPAR